MHYKKTEIGNLLCWDEGEFERYKRGEIEPEIPEIPKLKIITNNLLMEEYIEVLFGKNMET
jgi:hypothetical protein